MKSEELIKACSIFLYKLCNLVEQMNSLNYYDINISSEYFFIPLLNKLFDCDLHNMNTESNNSAVIDLYDSSGKIAIQVTSESTAQKIRKTVKEFVANGLYKKYSRLIVVVIVKKHNYRADFSNDTQGEFNFSTKDDIFTISDIINEIRKQKIELLQSIHDYLQFQLDTILDFNQISSINKEFQSISDNTRGILNEKYFEIDDESFITDFIEQLSEKDILKISSLSKEEGKYCVLNLLNKIKPDQPIYIVKTKDCWLKANANLSGYIMIPDFTAEEIPAMKANKTIFIHSLNSDDRICLPLPRRSRSFLAEKLRANGYEDAYNLVNKTQGMFYFIKRAIYTGQLSMPKWGEDTNKAIIIASLLGKWTECKGDIEIIEKLFENSYSEFMEYLLQYMGSESAFIIRKTDYFNNYTIYELSDPFLAVQLHKSIITIDSACDFLKLAIDVLSERSNKFDNPFSGFNIISGEESSKYSSALKHGISRTLILLSLYCDCQNEVDNCVRTILLSINNIGDWASISEYFESICESSPNMVLNRLEEELNNNTGMINLFTDDSSDFFCGKYYYTHILFSLEQLLPYKEYVARSIWILLKLGKQIKKCASGNSPRESLAAIFCIWHNTTALTVDEKIEFAKVALEQYKYFWDIIYDVIHSQTSLFSSNLTFSYREGEHLKEYTKKDYITFLKEFTRLLLSSTGNDLAKINKIIELLPECSDELFTEINRHISKIVSDMADKDKEAIKTTMRKIVYNHRKYADSDREITAERISQIEQLCLSIKFNDDTYDFIYLLNNDDIPIMRPAVFNDTNSNYLEDEKKTKEKIVEEEISRMKSLGIDLGHYLQLMDSKSYNHIGKYLALYYSDLQYSEAVLNSIINSTNNETVAVDYIKSCFQDNINGILETVDDMIEKGYSSTLYVSLLSVVPLNNKTIEYIEKLSIEDKKIYWSKPLLHIYNDKSIVKYLTDNLFKYSNWAQLFQILLYNGTMFSVEDTISIINRSIHKIIAEKYSFTGLDTYCIELILVNAYKQIGNQFDKFPELLNIEIQLFPYIKWKNMKCSQYMFKRNANLYAEVLSIIYKHDDNKPPKENIDSNVITRFFRLEHDIRFCPGEENGTINTRILKEWIETFRQQLTNQGQYYLFYEKLGHLFAFSPKGEDGIVPHESIRHIIEQSENNDIINGFVNSIYFDRGVYALTAGKNESRLAQEYSKLAKRLQIYYPKTAKIYSSLSERYKYDSIRDRKRAEDNII